MKLTMKFAILILWFCCISMANAANRLIIKYKPTQTQLGLLSSGQISKVELAKEQMKPLSTKQVSRLSELAGMKVKDFNPVGTGAHVIVLEKDVDPDTLQKIINKIAKETNVLYIEEDKWVYPSSIPELNPVQWDMESVSVHDGSTWYGANFTGGWSFLESNDLIPGESVIIAVVDSGYTPHPNFLTNLQTLSQGSESYGYQFIYDCRIAGSCPSSTSSNQAVIAAQPNGLDLGDYLTQSEKDSSNGFFSNCQVQNLSSWHGTHVAGTIVADGYNGESGVLGGAYGAKVVPIRALGKCGGLTSYVIDGILWAANKYPGISNSHPAQVINLSLGYQSSCSSLFQDAIDEVAPAVVVASAGNSSANVSLFAPANCENVISVAALGPLNQLAYYSNYGATTIAAPGGDVYTGGIDAEKGILSTIWGSAQAYNPSSGGSYDFYQGTSMAAPHVVAAVADIIGYLQANNQSWTVSRIEQILLNSASTDFDACSQYGCATQLKLNVESALFNLSNESQNELIPSTDSVSFESTSGSQTVTFSNDGVSPITLTNYTLYPEDSRLTVDATRCVNQIIAIGNSCNVVFNFAQTSNDSLSSTKLNSTSESVTVVFRLYDSNSLVVSTVIVSLPAAESEPVPPTPTPSSSSGGGGGCALSQSQSDAGLLILMLAISIIYIYRKKIIVRRK